MILNWEFCVGVRPIVCSGDSCSDAELLGIVRKCTMRLLEEYDMLACLFVMILRADGRGQVVPDIYLSVIRPRSNDIKFIQRAQAKCD